MPAKSAYLGRRRVQIETLIVRAALSELARAADWARQLADKHALSSSITYALQLCLEEAVSNIVRHGQPPPHGDIRLSFTTIENAALLTIEDCAMAFDPTKMASPAVPACLNDAPIGGLGIHLMRQFANGLSYERQNGCNRLTLRFEVAASGQ